MRARPSAEKHDIDPEDPIDAARSAVYVAALDEEHPQRELRPLPGAGMVTSGLILAATPVL